MVKAYIALLQPVIWCYVMSDRKKGYTSIRIDPKLWKEAKIEAIRRDMEVSELVDQALRKELGLKVTIPDERKLDTK